MNRIYNIKYTDAYYIDLSYGHNKKLHKTKLSEHEAYGYAEKYGNNIVIAFIKEEKDDRKISDKIKRKEHLIKGIIVPDTSILSKLTSFKRNIFKNIPLGSEVVVNWRDIVIVANQSRYDCSTMYTEGVFFRNEEDHIVLKNPETIRTYPTPVTNHPMEKPLFYVIPKSFIVDISPVNN